MRISVNNVTFFLETCCNCGIQFAMPDGYNDNLRSCKNTFYCPSGHPQHYTGMSDKQKLKDKDRRITNLANEINLIERSKSNLKGQITKLKKKEKV